MTVIAGIGSSGLLLLAPLPHLPPASPSFAADDGKKVLPPPLVSRLLDTLRMSRDCKMQRLVLVFVCTGAVKSFIYGTLPVLVSLAELKFLIMASVGGFVALASFFFGKLVKQYGEVRLFNVLFPTVFLVSLSSALVLRGGPAPSLPFLFFVASLFGACDGGLSTVSNALVGRLFPERKEPAFAAMQLLTSATTAFFFAVHNNLSPQGKATALCALAVASLISLRLLVSLLDRQSASSKHYGSRKTMLRVEEL
jgi:MFS family permease